jgi:hypothetical protein
MYRVEVRECHMSDGHWIWEWRVVSRWGVVAQEGGACASEDEARRDGQAAATWLTEVRQRGTWRA